MTQQTQTTQAPTEQPEAKPVPAAEPAKPSPEAEEERAGEHAITAERVREAILKPVVGAAVAGGLVIAAAAVWGAAEAAVGAAAAYGMYRLLHRHRSHHPD